MSSVQKITENTLLPISLVITLVGGVFWLTTIYSQSNANAVEIKEMKTKQELIIQELSEKQTLMLDRLARIEGRLESIQHKEK
jgi:hypothetical protein